MSLPEIQVLQDAQACHHGVFSASGEVEVEPVQDKKSLGVNKVSMGDKRGPMAHPRPDAKTPILPTQREVAVAQSRTTPRGGAAADHNRTTPRVFIPMSDQGVQKFSELASIIGEIQPGHRNPTNEEIVVLFVAPESRLETI